MLYSISHSHYTLCVFIYLGDCNNFLVTQLLECLYCRTIIHGHTIKYTSAHRKYENA